MGPVEPGPYEVWVDRPGYVPIRRKLTVLDPADGLVNVGRGTRRDLTDAVTLTWKMKPGR